MLKKNSKKEEEKNSLFLTSDFKEGNNIVDF